jgi:hypothetical protein
MDRGNNSWSGFIRWLNSELSDPPSLGTIGLKRRKKKSNIFALQQVENDLGLLTRTKPKFKFFSSFFQKHLQKCNLQKNKV